MGQRYKWDLVPYTNLFFTRRVCYAGTRLQNVLLSNIEVLSHDIKEFKSTWMDIS